MEHEKMLSVGIDIGTSTTSLIFSHLTLENTSGFFTVPSVSIIDTDVVYRSPVYRTPLIDRSLLDGEGVRRIVEEEYHKAGVEAARVQTGAVIITGESARKENASIVLQELSRFAGDFVVSTAGPDLESVIAGQGSGAQAFSRESGTVTANLDIGGGTTNVVVFDAGEVAARGCVDIGGRQAMLDEAGRIAYISPSAARIAKALGVRIRTGDPAGLPELEKLAEGMNRALEEMLGASEDTGLALSVKTAGSSDFIRPERRPVRYLFFSGGVADCIYHPGQEAFRYGDIGVLLGEAIRRGKLFSSFRVMEARETIRATVIGAGTCTTSISGSTIDYAEGLFPMKNVPVLAASKEAEEDLWGGKEEGISREIRWFLGQSDSDRLVIAFEGKADPDYSAMKRFAGAVSRAGAKELKAGEPLIMIFREDIAKAMGQLVRRELKDARPVVSVDEVRAEQNNYIDFGRPVMNGLVIPVVVKTLIFG